MEKAKLQKPQKDQEITNASEDVRRENPCAQLMVVETITVTVDNSMKFPQGIKTRTTMRSSNTASGYTSKGNKVIISKRSGCSHVHCSIIYSSQDRETTTYVSINRRMSENKVASTMDYYSALKSKEILSFAIT